MFFHLIRLKHKFCILFLWVAILGSWHCGFTFSLSLSDEIKSKMEKAELLLQDASTRDEAKAMYKHLIESFPNDAVAAYVELGRLFAQDGDFKNAERLCRDALKLDPKNAKANLMIGKIHFVKGETEMAHHFCEQSISLDPTNADAYYNLGKIFTRKSDFSNAVVAFTKSLELDGKDARCHFDLGLALGKLGRHEESEKHFELSKNLASSLDLITLGQVYQALGRYENARSELEQGLKQKPEHVHGWNTYAEVMELLSLDEKAIEAYERAIALNPTNPETYVRLAGVLSGTGLRNLAALNACGLDTERVITLYEKALQLKPDHPRASEGLISCQQEVNAVSQWMDIIQHAQEDENKSERHEKSMSTKVLLGNFAKTLLSRKVVSGSKSSAWPENVGGFKNIPEVTIGSAEELRKYVADHKPVVIKNFQDRFAAKEEWSLDSLRSKFGEKIVHVSISETGRFDGPESGNLWGVSEAEVLVRPARTSMKFSHFLDLMTLQNITETFYLEYLALHQYLGKEALEMVPQPQQALESGMEHLLTNFWMGFTPTTSPLHYDDYENLLCQIRGQKELIIFEPLDMGYLYYLGRMKGQLEYNFPGNFSRQNVSKSRNVVFASSVRLDNPDFTKHSDFLKAVPYKVEIHPGDVLYLPAYWHHEVKSTPDENSVNIAINFWYKNETFFAQEHNFLQRKPTHIEL